MKLLVTGGAGFIGSNFVEYVVEETDHAVITLDLLTYSGSRSNLAMIKDDPQHRFVEGDIRDEEIVNKLASQTDVIVNFAAESHVDKSIEGSTKFVSTNVQGTRVLLDAALEYDHERFLQVSTDEVYGEAIEGQFTEEDKLNPRNPYAATKAAADHLVKSYHETHDLPTLITRSSNNFGPRQHHEKLIPKFIKRAKAGKSLPLYGDGQQVREWTYVSDNCRAIVEVMESGAVGEVYNIGSGTELSNIEVTRTILDKLDKSEELIEFVEDRPGHDRRYALNCKRVQTLGWEPQISFEEGIIRTINHYSSDK